jgi:transglutaminase-like putative cysteine protease
VSSGAQVALLPPQGADRKRSPALAHTAGDRPRIRLAAFAALGLYGVLRWETLFIHPPIGRLVGLLALALLLAWAGPAVARRSRLLAAGAALLAALAALALAGVPIAWIVHVRIAVIATAIGKGLSALPRNPVPSPGGDRWVSLVMVLGPAILLLDAAFLLAFAQNGLGQLRRATVLLPLVALIAVPTTLLRPKFAYLDGLILFALVAGFLWGDRVQFGHRASALGLCGLAAVAAMVIAPALDPGKPLFDYRGIGGVGTASAIDTFNWEQQYGPINWPRSGHPVLEVKTQRADYWKAEDLDIFDGRAWAQGVVAGAQNLAPGPPAALSRWQQTIEVKVRDMRTSDVIGSGFSGHPADVPQPVIPGFSPGTWTATSSLNPGDTYVVQVYSPHPSEHALSRARPDYAAVPPGYRTILLPAAVDAGQGGGQGFNQVEVEFPPFHSHLPVTNVIGAPVVSGSRIIDRSPYGQAYSLATRLARSAATPYAYARSIERLLGHGYRYNEDPPIRPYPLESFLFSDKLGYCQQFAGAMALLLRMGGVPARVAVGFTQGTFDSASRRWIVTDIDAHAWVEAWFAGYGWVRFDPTPPTAPALSHATPIPSLGAISGAVPTKIYSTKRQDIGTSSVRASKGHGRGGTSTGLEVAEIAALAALVVGLPAAALLGSRPLRTNELALAELERAFMRTGRPLAAGVTLAGLERRFRSSPEAAGYIRGLRLQRFGRATDGAPGPRQRRALRAELGSGLGPLGRLRALWALPPRRR